MDLGQTRLGILGCLLMNVPCRVQHVFLIHLLERSRRPGGGTCGGERAKDDLGKIRGWEGRVDIVKVDVLLFQDRGVGEGFVQGHGAATESEDAGEGVGSEGVADDALSDGTGAAEDQAGGSRDRHLQAKRI